MILLAFHDGTALRFLGEFVLTVRQQLSALAAGAN
jgi:hypothetical protein